MTTTVKSTQEDLPGVTLSLGGAGVQVAQFQGARDYQEDTFMLASSVPVKPGEERRFLEKSIGTAVGDTKHFTLGGSTVVAALITPDRVLHAAGLGDSEINVYVRSKETGDITALRVTREHTLNNPDELKRVVGNATVLPCAPFIKGENGTIMVHKSGGRLVDPETGGNTMITRGCGNTGIPGMTGELDPEKDIKSIDLKAWPEDKFDVYVELCSDGLAKKTGGDLALIERVNYLQDTLGKNPGANIADTLANFAIASGSHDNCTSVIFSAAQKMDSNVFLVLADGHTMPNKYGLPMTANPAVTVADSMERSARQGLQPAVTMHAVRSIEKEDRAPITQRMIPPPTP